MQHGQKAAGTTSVTPQMQQSIAAQPGGLPVDRQNALAQEMGLSLGNLDWSKIPQILSDLGEKLQFISTLWGSLMGGLGFQPANPPQQPQKP